MTTDNNQNNDFLFSEAPASWNTRYVDPNGFECQFTLRAENGQDLLEKANSAIAYLLKHDCKPYSYNRNSYRAKKANRKPADSNKGSSNGNTGNQSSQDSSWCSIHECDMQRWEKDGRVWYSHKVDGEWCTGKAKS